MFPPINSARQGSMSITMACAADDRAVGTCIVIQVGVAQAYAIALASGRNVSQYLIN